MKNYEAVIIAVVGVLLYAVALPVFAAVFSFAPVTVNPSRGYVYYDDAIRSLGVGSSTPYATISAQGYDVQTSPIIALASSTGKFQWGVDKNGTVMLGVQNSQNGNMSNGTTTLVAGISTVSTSRVAADSMIEMYYCNTVSPVNLGATTLSVQTKSAGVSFVASSSSRLDTSTICWEIKKPAY